MNQFIRNQYSEKLPLMRAAKSLAVLAPTATGWCNARAPGLATQITEQHVNAF